MGRRKLLAMYVDKSRIAFCRFSMILGVLDFLRFVFLFFF